MAFDLPSLPYALNALQPHLSARTLEIHHGKHHQAYLSNLNSLVRDTPLANSSLEDIIRQTVNDETNSIVFNNAAQAWNHAFFWNSLTPAKTQPHKELAERLEKDFGSLDKFKEQFKQAGVSQFGSGWAWLVLDSGTLKVTKTPNALNPLALGQAPLLTCDVWEHAYYLDYQNRRADFIEAFLTHLVNWDFVSHNLASAA